MNFCVRCGKPLTSTADNYERSLCCACMLRTPVCHICGHDLTVDTTDSGLSFLVCTHCSYSTRGSAKAMRIGPLCTKCGHHRFIHTPDGYVCAACFTPMPVVNTGVDYSAPTRETEITVVVKPGVYVGVRPTVGMRIKTADSEWGDYTELSELTHDQIQSAISELLNRYWQGDASKLVEAPSKYIK